MKKGIYLVVSLCLSVRVLPPDHPTTPLPSKNENVGSYSPPWWDCVRNHPTHTHTHAHRQQCTAPEAIWHRDVNISIHSLTRLSSQSVSLNSGGRFPDPRFMVQLPVSPPPLLPTVGTHLVRLDLQQHKTSCTTPLSLVGPCQPPSGRAGLSPVGCRGRMAHNNSFMVFTWWVAIFLCQL